MLWEVFQGFYILHVLFLIVTASGFYLFWARTGFWFPTYVHVLAVIALALSIRMMTTISDDAPISKYGHVAKVLFTFVLPTVVYFFFVFYGGQHAAYHSRFQTLTCPRCQQTVTAERDQNTGRAVRNPYAKQCCPHCGEEIG